MNKAFLEYLEASYKEQMRIAEQSRGKDERQFDLSVDRVAKKWWTSK
jgi:hypothetical protein